MKHQQSPSSSSLSSLSGFADAYGLYDDEAWPKNQKRMRQNRNALLSLFFGGAIVGILVTLASALSVGLISCRSVPSPCPVTAEMVQPFGALDDQTAPPPIQKDQPDRDRNDYSKNGLFGGFLYYKKSRQAAQEEDEARRRKLDQKQQPQPPHMQCPVTRPQEPLGCACQLFWEKASRYTFGLIQPPSASLDHCPSDGSQKGTAILSSKPASSSPTATATESTALEVITSQHKSLRNKYPTAFTSLAADIASSEQSLIAKFGEQIHAAIPDFEQRIPNVSWGGPGGPAWYQKATGKAKSSSSSSSGHLMDGAALLYSYLRIMNWPIDLRTKFPFKLCHKGCDANAAINHTLTYREIYKPWVYGPKVIQENQNGFFYHHGFSPSHEHNVASVGKGTASNEFKGSHALVWARLGRRNVVDDLANVRAYVNTLERAVAASTERSDGQIGKFNVILDGTGSSWRTVPSIKMIKVFVTMLQDHFPNRLGIILLMNLGRAGEFFVKMILPLLTEEVRQKLIVLPRDEEERRAVLETVVATQYIPTWLGGEDTFEFDASQYYSNAEFLVSEETANAYVDSMPYHA